MIPTMIVVAGPPGSGKSTLMPVRLLGVDSFNVDDRCRQLHGSYEGIPRRVRMVAGAECEAFVRDHIDKRMSFAVETTLRTAIAMNQADDARNKGFVTVMLFFCTEDPEIHVRRVKARSHNGGHAAPEHEIRTTYASSLANLPHAFRTFEVVECYDTSTHDLLARHVASVNDGQISHQLEPLPTWLRNALDSLHNHPCSR